MSLDILIQGITNNPVDGSRSFDRPSRKSSNLPPASKIPHSRPKGFLIKSIRIVRSAIPIAPGEIPSRSNDDRIYNSTGAASLVAAVGNWRSRRATT
jgi:hypothetical protein